MQANADAGQRAPLDQILHKRYYVRVIARALVLVLLVSASMVSVASDPAQLAGVAEAKKRVTRYCTVRSKPRGCIKIPPNAFRDRGVDPQEPPDRVVIGGIGGGIGGADDLSRERGAFDWASGFTRSTGWAYRSERFVEEAYGTRRQYQSPREALTKLRINHGPPESAPLGTLMLFRADKVNRKLGHVGLSVGGGAMLSALDKVTRTDVAGSRYWTNIYVGWAHAPRGWPGRVPQPFDLVGPGVEGVRILSPTREPPLRGAVVLAATAPAGQSIDFAVYYSDDPVNRVRPTWHPLGRATDSGGTHVLGWDTTQIIDQGDAQLSTVTIAAIAVDAAGTQIGVGDYRRVTVHNAVP